MRDFLMSGLCVGLLSICLLIVCAGTAAAAEVAVVDTVKLFTDSKPAKAGAAHIKKVTSVLQKGLDDLVASYKKQPETPEIRQVLANGQIVLERELAAQRELVAAELNRCLAEATANWRAKNKGTLLVIAKQAALDADAKIEITRAVMAEMNKISPQFPDMPKVSIQKPEAAASKSGSSKSKK